MSGILTTFTVAADTAFEIGVRLETRDGNRLDEGERSPEVPDTASQD